MGRGRKTNLVISLTGEEREELDSWQRSRTIRSGLARRGRVIVMLADGASVSEAARVVGCRRRFVYRWARRFLKDRVEGLEDKPGRGRKPFFPPEVAVHLVKIACERPDQLGRSLSQWECSELARELLDSGVVSSISAETVRRILSHHQLKPWRHHMWLGPKHPRDQEFYTRTSDLIDLYTRDLPEDEIGLCIDEKTSLQPRVRLRATLPALPGNIPNRVEHEYKRAGALNLFAAFEIGTGHVYGQSYRRKRQREFIAFLEYLDGQVPANIKTIHVVCDNLPTHRGKQVCKWLEGHPRFRFHFTPRHCSWMNQVEQWFSILQRKRFRVADFASIEDLEAKIEQFITQWNHHAHPFNWSTQSVAKVMAEAPVKAAA